MYSSCLYLAVHEELLFILWGDYNKCIFLQLQIIVRNFLFLTCPTRTRTSCLPQTTPQTTTTAIPTIPRETTAFLIIPTTTFPSQTTNHYNQPTHHHYNTNVPNHQYLKGSTPTRLELMTLGTATSATSVTPVQDPLVQRLTTIPLYLTIIGSQVHKQR